MPSFQIDDMHCGHCVRSITEAVKRADPAARLHFDLAARRLDIDTADSPANTHPDTLAAAIQAAGYHPVAAPAAASAVPVAAPATRAGCCCR